jgi:hypothetical protein
MANKKLPRQIHPKAADDRQYKDVMLKLKSVSGASSSNVVKKTRGGRGADQVVEVAKVVKEVEAEEELSRPKSWTTLEYHSKSR